MAYEPSEAELDAYEKDHDATMTPVIVAPGPLPSNKRTIIDGAFRGVLVWATLQGIPRVFVEVDYEPVLEFTKSRVVSARMESKMLSSDATVEVYVRKDVDDGQRECVLINGPKRNLKAAFASIGFTL